MTRPGHVPRRIRLARGRGPLYALRVPSYLSQEQAEEIRRRFLAAQRQGTPIVMSDNMEVVRVR